MGRKRILPDKNCLVCGNIHRNRGSYCSKVCSNKGRTVTAEHKAKTSASMTKFMNSDSDVAEQARWRINNYENYEKAEAVVPGYIPDTPYYFDGEDLWFDNN